MTADEWIEIARLDPITPGQNRIGEVPGVVDAWLADNELGRDQLSEGDIRVDLAYLGPGDGRCAVIVSVRQVVLDGQ